MGPFGQSWSVGRPMNFGQTSSNFVRSKPRGPTPRGCGPPIIGMWGLADPHYGRLTYLFRPFSSYTHKKRSHTQGGSPTSHRGLVDPPLGRPMTHFHPQPLYIGACKETQHQVILPLDFEAVSSNGREGRSRGSMDPLWSLPLHYKYPLTPSHSTHHKKKLSTLSQDVVLVLV
jgi:hypothetical protein